MHPKSIICPIEIKHLKWTSSLAGFTETFEQNEGAIASENILLV
jgi:hypothetical protein